MRFEQLMKRVGMAIATLSASGVAGQDRSAEQGASYPNGPAVGAIEQPRLGDDGTVKYSSSLAIPFSGFASDEARQDFVAAAKDYPPGFLTGNPFAPDRMMATRQWFDERARQGAQAIQALYPVTIKREVIGGVQTDVVMPEGGVSLENTNRVLINLHGGGFVFGARWVGLIESIPVASVGKLKIVTVDYRMGPEHKFPSASEDVAKVYSALLRNYRPENIGIYGCSAGGALTLQSVVWFQAHDLPRPGAIGVYCAGGSLSSQGDSSYTGAILGGRRAPPLEAPPAPYRWLYYSPGDATNPLAAPLSNLEALADFPPTLMVSGTRDFALSNVLATHRALVNAGVDADLHVFEGLQHAFHYSPRSPEAREVYHLTARFFMKNLGNKPK